MSLKQQAAASAVEGTLGPKGLDTMLVDRFGEVVVTNDGVTITVVAEEGAQNAVFSGVIVRNEKLSRQMPVMIENTRVLVVDDALGPEEIGEAALATESGFARYLGLKEEFVRNLTKIRELGVGLVLVDRSVDEAAQEFLAEGGITAAQRVSSRELVRAAEHTGARMIKRTGLTKPPAELAACLGEAGRVAHDEKLGQVRIQDGKGKPMATVLVGAATAEVVGGRERIARDAAAALQAAVKGGSYRAGWGA